MMETQPPQQQEDEVVNNGNEETTTAGEMTATHPYIPHNQLEQTLAIIKPDAIDRAEEIISVIHREGFSVLQARRVKLSAEQAASFYQDMYNADWFQGCVENLSSGPLLAMVLSGPGAVRHWHQLLGPSSWEERSKVQKCLRNKYGIDGDDHKNALHGSETSEDALRELHFFFPELIVEPTIATNLASHYLNQNVHPVLTVGLSKLVRERPDDPVIWLADWLLANNPNKPKEQSLNQPGKCK
ncbi:Nucleoside diphosphate kinase 5 [Orchesella cincta]|uniref:Nucleoside diphosphate kinase 5 n=1 Tax=Orchesella cincta TaxID=48709 RepID=A0A1D2NMB1_ORCCI|nr:Nucleoside diphosphate kinase 5 [Orchesella cincta]